MTKEEYINQLKQEEGLVDGFPRKYHCKKFTKQCYENGNVVDNQSFHGSMYVSDIYMYGESDFYAVTYKSEYCDFEATLSLKFPKNLEDKVKTMNNKKVYLAGDMLSKGSQLLRTQEKEEIKEAVGFDIYNPMDNKEINDKQNLDNNDGLAEKIVKQDTQGILESDIMVIDVNQIGIGTQVELGQIHGLKLMAQMVRDVLQDKSLSKEEALKAVNEMTIKMIEKIVLIHLEDVRRTTGKNSTETGDRRSFSVNQYVNGIAMELTDGVGIMSWEEVMSSLKSIAIEDKHEKNKLEAIEFPNQCLEIMPKLSTCYTCSFTDVDLGLKQLEQATPSQITIVRDESVHAKVYSMLAGLDEFKDILTMSVEAQYATYLVGCLKKADKIKELSWTEFVETARIIRNTINSLKERSEELFVKRIFFIDDSNLPEKFSNFVLENAEWYKEDVSTHDNISPIFKMVYEDLNS